jgi:hypothetical protein
MMGLSLLTALFWGLFEMIGDLLFVVVAALGGMIVSVRWGRRTLAHLRNTEWPEMEKSQPLSRSVLNWTIAHIRDDLGMVFSVLVITNGLLAGILTALLLQSFR